MKYLQRLLTILFLAAVFSEKESVFSIEVQVGLELTEAETVALDEFKVTVGRILPHDYMHEDIYLIRWLRAKNLDIRQAKRLLEKNLEWRKKNKVDTILDEDLSYWVPRYPFWLDGRDKENRPVATMDIAVWDPRPAIIAGKANELFRYAVSVAEMGVKLIREDRKNGLNVSQFTLVANLDGFNLNTHACAQCVPFYLRFLVMYENYYPGMLHKLFFLNTPPQFDTLLRIARPALSKQTSDAWTVFGVNKAQWVPVVREYIDPDQIRPQFGGTKVDTEME